MAAADRAWRCARLAFGLAVLLVATAAEAQRLLNGRWQASIAASVAALTIITVDGDGWVHGTIFHEPPLDGFAGAPFTTRIENGAFTIRFVNGSRYEDLHWCGAALCGAYVAPDGSAAPARFDRPDGK